MPLVGLDLLRHKQASKHHLRQFLLRARQNGQNGLHWAVWSCRCSTFQKATCRIVASHLLEKLSAKKYFALCRKIKGMFCKFGVIGTIDGWHISVWCNFCSLSFLIVLWYGTLAPIKGQCDTKYDDKMTISEGYLSMLPGFSVYINERLLQQMDFSRYPTCQLEIDPTGYIGNRKVKLHWIEHG